MVDNQVSLAAGSECCSVCEGQGAGERGREGSSLSGQCSLPTRKNAQEKKDPKATGRTTVPTG